MVLFGTFYIHDQKTTRLIAYGKLCVDQILGSQTIASREEQLLKINASPITLPQLPAHPVLDETVLWSNYRVLTVL